MRFKEAEIIVLANQKGGCGKTTTAISLAAGFALKGYRTCIVDLDAQCNVTSMLGVDLEQLRRDNQPTILDVYLANRPARDIVVELRGRLSDNLAVLPGHRGLDQVYGRLESEVRAPMPHEQRTPYDEDDLRQDHRVRLRRSLDTLRQAYDIVVIDTAPALDFVLTTALAAADWYVIPVFASAFDLDGLTKLTGTVKKVRERVNPRIQLLGVVQGNYDTRTALDRDIYETLAGQFKECMCETRISRAVAHREATVYRSTIFEHSEKSKAADEFHALCEELLGRLHDEDERRGYEMTPPVQRVASSGAAGEAVVVSGKAEPVDPEGDATLGHSTGESPAPVSEEVQHG